MADTVIDIFFHDSEPGSYREGEHPRKPDGKFVPATEKPEDKPQKKKKKSKIAAALGKKQGSKPDLKANPLSGKRKLKRSILKRLKKLRAKK